MAPRRLAAPGRRPIHRHTLCLYPYREDLRQGRYYPPLGLEIIARVLQPHSQALDVVDLRHERATIEWFLRPDTDLVGVSVNWDRDGDFVRQQVRAIPERILTVMGGRHATEDPEGWLRSCPGVDILVRGDGEEAVEEIARGRCVEEIPGISYRRGTEIVHQAHRPYGVISEDLYPDRRLRRYTYEMDFEGIGTGIRVDSLAGSRGCPYRCRFCSFTLNPWGQRRPHGARSPESVVRELATMDADLVVFTDDNFTHDMDRVDRLCDLILRRRIRKRYVVNARVEIARRMDVVRKMEQAGFVALLLGIESAHDRTLRAMQKGLDRARLLELCAALRHTSMVLHGYFILGCLGESREEILEIAPFAHQLGLDTLGLSPLRTVPHDGLRSLVEATAGYHISEEGYVYSDALSRRDLRQVRREVWRRFYTPGHMLRLTHRCLRGGILSPRELVRFLVTGIRGDQVRRQRRRLRRRGVLRRSG